MKRSSTVIVVAVALLVVGAVALAVKRSSSNSPSPTPTVATNTTPTTSADTSSPAAAGMTAAITGGTNGPSCNSGGYFKPSAVTVGSGGKVTFSVPADDPYSGGLQINGLPGGPLMVPRGGSATTPALTSTVSFNGTWPDETACKKGSGTITVQ